MVAPDLNAWGGRTREWRRHVTGSGAYSWGVVVLGWGLLKEGTGPSSSHPTRSEASHPTRFGANSRGLTWSSSWGVVVLGQGLLKEGTGPSSSHPTRSGTNSRGLTRSSSWGLDGYLGYPCPMVPTTSLVWMIRTPYHLAYSLKLNLVALAPPPPPLMNILIFHHLSMWLSLFGESLNLIPIKS
jgi:hypothetical protein